MGKYVQCLGTDLFSPDVRMTLAFSCMVVHLWVCFCSPVVSISKKHLHRYCIRNYDKITIWEVTAIALFKTQAGWLTWNNNLLEVVVCSYCTYFWLDSTFNTWIFICLRNFDGNHKYYCHYTRNCCTNHCWAAHQNKCMYTWLISIELR
jgi:hypothetical protein